MVVECGIDNVSAIFYKDHMIANNDRWFLLQHINTKTLELCFYCIQVIFKATTF